MQCPGVYHNPSPVPNPGSSSRVSLHHVPLTNTFVSGQGRGACSVCSMPLLPSMLGGVTQASVIREILGEAGWTLCQKYNAASHTIPLHCTHFIQAPKRTQTRDCCDMVEGKTHEEVAHEKLVTRLARLRNAASEAVLWEDHAKLVQVAKAFTCITPTKRAIAETGVGHLLADKTVGLKAAMLPCPLRRKRTDWKEKVKHTICDRQLTAAGRRPLVAMKAEMYMDFVNDLVDWLKTVDEVPADPVCRKKLAATLVQHSVFHWKHLDSIDPESLQVLHPTQAALLRRATAQATRFGRGGRPMIQDRGLASTQLSSTTCSSTVDARHKSALAVAGQMSQ